MATNFGFMPVLTGRRYFISYKSADTERVGAIARKLNEMGVPMWYDYGIEKGERWSSEINRNIEGCEAVVLFATKALFAAEDTYVRKEFRLARGYGKKIYVVWLDDVSFGEVNGSIKDWFLDIEDLQGIRTVDDSDEKTAWQIVNEFKLFGGHEPQPPSPDYHVSNSFGAQMQNITVGDTVTFGQYPQGENGEIMPLEWRVLDLRDGKALLLTHKIADCKPYHNVMCEVTWEICALRQWLNGQFIKMAFSNAQQEKIAPVTNQNPDNPEYHTKGGSATQDKVFVLSIDEVNTYFLSDSSRKAYATPYAVRNGAYVDKDNGGSLWWLRSPGFSKLDAAYVDNMGEIDLDGDDVLDDVFSSTYGVRPALWLNLTS